MDTITTVSLRSKQQTRHKADGLNVQFSNSSLLQEFWHLKPLQSNTFLVDSQPRTLALIQLPLTPSSKLHAEDGSVNAHLTIAGVLSTTRINF
ncbi:hypothetical protein AAMO2058_001287400 [Amorphochlora amoebiformis]